MDAEAVFKSALERVESKSIRDWAQTDHNRPLLVRFTQGVIDKGGVVGADVKVSTFIVCTAIGL